MKKCTNCEIDKHRKYCSLTCRNIYVNKNLRDYSKNKKSIKEKYLHEYYDNPKFCKECGKVINYKKKNNKFCDHSYTAKNINKIMNIRMMD